MKLLLEREWGLLGLSSLFQDNAEVLNLGCRSSYSALILWLPWYLITSKICKGSLCDFVGQKCPPTQSTFEKALSLIEFICPMKIPINGLSDTCLRILWSNCQWKVVGCTKNWDTLLIENMISEWVIVRYCWEPRVFRIHVASSWFNSGVSLLYSPILGSIGVVIDLRFAKFSSCNKFAMYWCWVRKIPYYSWNMYT